MEPHPYEMAVPQVPLMQKLHCLNELLPAHHCRELGVAHPVSFGAGFDQFHLGQVLELSSARSPETFKLKEHYGDSWLLGVHSGRCARRREDAHFQSGGCWRWLAAEAQAHSSFPAG